MTPIIIDAETRRELWRVNECAGHCDLTPSSWRAYSSKGRTPEAVGSLDAKTPLWDAEAVREWQASRPGSPGRPHHRQ